MNYTVKQQHQCLTKTSANHQFGFPQKSLSWLTVYGLVSPASKITLPSCVHAGAPLTPMEIICCAVVTVPSEFVGMMPWGMSAPSVEGLRRKPRSAKRYLFTTRLLISQFVIPLNLATLTTHLLPGLVGLQNKDRKHKANVKRAGGIYSLNHWAYGHHLLETLSSK